MTGYQKSMAERPGLFEVEMEGFTTLWKTHWQIAQKILKNVSQWKIAKNSVGVYQNIIKDPENLKKSLCTRDKAENQY